jgi:hypothetical protein
MFAERYGLSYGDVVSEVNELVDSTLSGDFDRGDLVNLRRLVEVDYGKSALESPVSTRRRFGSGCALFFLAVVGGAVIYFGAGSSEVSCIVSSVSWPGVMTGGGGKKKNASGRKPVMSNGKAKPRAKGSGLYTLPAALTKVLKSSVVSAVKSSIPKGTFEKRGAQFGRGLANIVGFGDYVVNDIVSMNNMKNLKKFGGGNASQLVSNCEYVGDIIANGSSLFTNTSRYLSPTDNTFPWLSQVAKLYTKYRFRQLLFEYRSMSSEYSSQIGLGTVVMAPIYNPDQPDFATKQQMEAASHAVSFKPSNSAFCGVECARKDNNFSWYNVRLTDMERTPLTDFAHMNIAIAGLPNNVASGTVMGELWVHYTCELLEPIISPKLELSYEGFYGAIKTTDTAAGLLLDCAFGIAKSAAGNRVNMGCAAAKNLKSFTMTSGKPDTQYWVAFDDINYTSGGSAQQDRLWFAQPGVYVIRWACQFSTQVTGIPGVGVNWWIPTFPIGKASIATVTGAHSLSGAFSNPMYSGDRMCLMWETTIAITDVDVPVSFRPNGSFAGLSAAVLAANQGSVLEITQMPLA